MKSILAVTVLWLFICTSTPALAYVVDHNCTNLGTIPAAAINQAKTTLHIAYGHTSHGSQLITGMTGLDGQTALTGSKGDIYQWNEGGANGALDIDDYFTSGDLGHSGDTTWADRTRSYLDAPANSDVNVVIWSWCGGCSDNTSAGIQAYLDAMTQLENEYPNVTFVYMTGHSDGTGETGNLHLRNQQIRNYCITHNKVLYDFYDIEIYDPDNHYFGDKWVNDACDYDSDNDGSRDANWATAWQNSHIEGTDWYSCSSAHSQPLNANRKAYAAWWLWARIAGWDGGSGADTDAPTIPRNPYLSIVSANEVDLSWDESSDDTAVAGYHIYYKRGDMNPPFSGTDAAEGHSPIDVGDVLTSSVSGLDRGIPYYFAVTAYDAAGNESAYSDIVSNQWMPKLRAPSNNETAVPTPTTFRWDSAPAGMSVTYTLYYSTSPNLEAVLPPAGRATPTKWLSVVIILLSVTLIAAVPLQTAQRRKFRYHYIPLLFCVAIVATACGGGGGSGSSAGAGSSNAVVHSVDNGTETYYEATNLDGTTTYYWKVVATDTSDSSVTYSSETYRFTTD